MSGLCVAAPARLPLGRCFGVPPTPRHTQSPDLWPSGVCSGGCEFPRCLLAARLAEPESSQIMMLSPSSLLEVRSSGWRRAGDWGQPRRCELCLVSLVAMSECVTESHSVVSDSLRPHRR